VLGDEYSLLAVLVNILYGAPPGQLIEHFVSTTTRACTKDH
jgi:hypothetical protein